MVQSYMTGRTIIPDCAKITKVETIVDESAVNQIAGDIVNNLSHGKEDAHGMILSKTSLMPMK
jgi:hypothetical protein